MERLTLKAGLGGKTGLCGMASTEFCFEQKDCYTCSHGKMCFDRLAAYEDTGLEPGEIVKLAQAEKDGRLVVLPCKVGDTLWSYCWRYCNRPWPELCSCKVTAVSTLNGKTVLNTDILQVISASEIGETVFLTRAEAEAALETKGEEDG